MDKLSNTLQQVMPQLGEDSRQGSGKPSRWSAGRCWATESEKWCEKPLLVPPSPQHAPSFLDLCELKSLLFFACSQADKAGENRINT